MLGTQGWRKRIAQKAGRLHWPAHPSRIGTELWEPAKSATMTLKLHTYPGNKNAFKALIAAQYIGVQIEVPPFNFGVDNKKPEFLKLNPNGKVGVSLGVHVQELLHALRHHDCIDKLFRLVMVCLKAIGTAALHIVLLPAHLSLLQLS